MVFRNNRSGLTFLADEDDNDIDLGDAEDAVSEIGLVEDWLGSENLASFVGKELVNDPDTRFVYDPNVP